MGTVTDGERTSGLSPSLRIFHDWSEPHTYMFVDFSVLSEYIVGSVPLYTFDKVPRVSLVPRFICGIVSFPDLGTRLMLSVVPRPIFLSPSEDARFPTGEENLSGDETRLYGLEGKPAWERVRRVISPKKAHHFNKAAHRIISMIILSIPSLLYTITRTPTVQYTNTDGS